MTTLIRVFDEAGRETRRCDARCHRADPNKRSRCVCGGWLRGCERGLNSALDIDPDYLNWVRQQVKLKPGEHVQLRIGA